VPRDSRLTRARILDAAERLFAENGYDGVSIRAIAAEADVQLALIHYHFGTKLEVHRAIWQSRYTSEVASRRNLMLASVDYRKPRRQVIRKLVEIFLLPLFKMKSNPDLKHFVALGARETIDPKESERGIIEEFLDPPARQFLDCFARALPEVPAQDIAWGYQAMVGVSILHIADKGRVTRISGGNAKSGDTQSATTPLVDFCTGGWLLLAQRRAKSLKGARQPGRTQLPRLGRKASQPSVPAGKTSRRPSKNKPA
jgi:AcrR family transcriptional regulator